MKWKLLTGLLACMTCAANFAHAERDNRGAYVGGTFGSATLEVGNYDESGISFGAIGGYQFNQWFALEGHLYVAEVGDSDIDLYTASMEVTPKFIFQVNDNVGFYAKAGFASIALSVEEDSDESFAGVGFNYGLGAIIAPSEHLHVQIGYSSTSAELEHEDNDFPDIDADISQLSLGVYYHF